MVEAFKRGWRGEERLWKIWWLWGLVAAIIIAVAFGMFFGGVVYPARVIVLPYFIWWYVAAWRCSPNADSKVWTILARILIVLGVIGEVLGLAGFLMGTTPTEPGM